MKKIGVFPIFVSGDREDDEAVDVEVKRRSHARGMDDKRLRNFAYIQYRCVPGPRTAINIMKEQPDV